MNICLDCGQPIDKPHNHNTLIVINGEPQSIRNTRHIKGKRVWFDGQAVTTKRIPVIETERQIDDRLDD